MRNGLRFDNRFKRKRSLFDFFFGFVLVLILCGWVGLAFFIYKAVSIASEKDWSGGIKPVIEQFWCGSPGCLGDETDNH
jgi:hypothetical protein